MSKKFKKNVNEEVVEEIKTDEKVESTDVEKKKRKIGIKGIIKIAAGVVILATGAAITLIALGGSDDDSTQVDANVDELLTVDEIIDSEDSDDKTEETAE